LWDTKIHDALKQRSHLASEELAKIMEDTKGYPINYNHYYTDTIKRRRQNRQRIAIKETAEKASKTTILPEQAFVENPAVTTTVDIDQLVQSLAESNDHNMENFSCEEALDCLFAIYKVRSPSPSPTLIPTFN
jgi:hypothetical protein